MTTYTLTEAQRQQLLYVSLAGVSKANWLATKLLQSLVASEAAPSTSHEPLESLRYWIAAYSNRASGEHFQGHGMVVKLLRDYEQLLSAAQAAPSTSQPLTNEQIEVIWVEHGLDDCDPQGFARAIESAILNAAPSTSHEPVARFVADVGFGDTPKAEPEGRANAGDETNGSVKRFAFGLLGNTFEIIPATNGAYVWYYDYLKLVKQLAIAQPKAEAAPSTSPTEAQISDALNAARIAVTPASIKYMKAAWKAVLTIKGGA